MIDTHSHPYLEEFDEDRHEVMDRARAAGVERIILPNVDLNSIGPMRRLHEEYPDVTAMAMGLHPTEVRESWRDDIARIDEEWARNRDDYVAVGEVGIDLYWDKTFEEQQMIIFETQMERARRDSLPVIIHCREGLDQTLEVLAEFPGVQAVFHSFGGGFDEIEKIRRVGDYYFGLNGVVTFKNCRTRETFAEIGLDRMLLETDAPYLAPVPKRGKRNEPAFVAHVAAHVAQTMNLPLETIDARTTENALKLFF